MAQFLSSCGSLMHDSHLAVASQHVLAVMPYLSEGVSSYFFFRQASLSCKLVILPKRKKKKKSNFFMNRLIFHKAMWINIKLSAFAPSFVFQAFCYFLFADVWCQAQQPNLVCCWHRISVFPHFWDVHGAPRSLHNYRQKKAILLFH